MEQWKGKVAVITGASSGIGEATAIALVKAGVKVVGLARRENKLKALAAILGKDKFFPIQCDVTKESDIVTAFKWIEKHLRGADILINNAGVSGLTPVISAPTAEIHKVIDTNLIAATICVREYTESLKKRKVPGHIIIMNSISGRFAEAITFPFGIYGPSKYGLYSLATELRHEYSLFGLNIKITNISPGVVLTELITSVAAVVEEVNEWKSMKPEDIANATLYTLGTPSTVEVHEITIMPSYTPVAIAKKQ